MPSILKTWVENLGLRQQGVLLTVIRGCDTAPKDDPSKLFTRCIRDVLLNAHCGDAKKAATFIQHVEPQELHSRFTAFRKNLDHYPHHYIAHVLHAIEIIGFLHPDENISMVWLGFYLTLCRGLHVRPETFEDMQERLNADEVTFAAMD